MITMPMIRSLLEDNVPADSRQLVTAYVMQLVAAHQFKKLAQEKGVKPEVLSAISASIPVYADMLLGLFSSSESGEEQAG